MTKKTLYRLAGNEPIQTLNMPVAAAVCEELKLGLEDLIAWQKPAPKLHRISGATQARLDKLMSQNNEGALTAAERRELHALVTEVEGLSRRNARLLGRQAAATREPLPSAAARPRRKAA